MAQLYPPNPESGGSHAGSRSADSYCKADSDPVEGDITTNCYFDENDGFKLKISASVPQIVKQDQHDYDLREITMISKGNVSDYLFYIVL
jgi:hypothetical protein